MNYTDPWGLEGKPVLAQSRDLNSDDILQKSEADSWRVNGDGVDIYVDNSKIDWSGLEVSGTFEVGEIVYINTTAAFRYLPRETAATYWWTSFEVVDVEKRIIRVLDQTYHYDYRDNNDIENIFRNAATYVGSPSNDGTDYMIIYINPLIWLEE